VHKHYFLENDEILESTFKLEMRCKA